jgi:hypothetical protein
VVCCTLIACAWIWAQPALAQTAAPQGWKEFRYPEFHVMFRAPATAMPVVQDNTSKDGDGPHTPEHAIIVQGGDTVAWIIDIGDITGQNLTLNVDGVPDGVIKSLKAHLVGPVRTVSVPGADAREYDAASDEVVLRSRAIVAGPRLFQALVLSRGKTLPPDTDAFLSSLTPLP